MLNTKLNQSNIEIMVKSIAANTEVANKIAEKLLNGDAYNFETEFGEFGKLIDDFLKNRLIDIFTLATVLTFDDDYHTLFEIDIFTLTTVLTFDDDYHTLFEI